MHPDPRIDTLRGLACVLLVLYHVIGSDPASGLRVADGAMRWASDGLAYLRMPLFTALSGLVYGMRPFDGDSRRFLAGKARRLLVPMLVVGTAFALLQAQVPSANGRVTDWATLHLEPVAHFWFVESLFWVFLAVWALERRGVLDAPRGFALAWLCAAALYLAVDGPHWLGIEGAIYLMPYFLGGLAVSRLSLGGLLRGAPARALLLAAAVLAVVQLGLPEPNPDRRTPWILLAGLSLCGLCLGLELRSRLLARIGAASYAVFLFHVFFTAASRIGLEHLGGVPLALQAVAGLAAGIAGPMLVDRLASRSRYGRVMLLGQAAGPSPRRAPDTGLPA